MAMPLPTLSFGLFTSIQQQQRLQQMRRRHVSMYDDNVNRLPFIVTCYYHQGGICDDDDDDQSNNLELPKTISNNNDLTLIPLCFEPIILQSSKPLLTPEECQILIDYFNSRKQQALDPINTKIDNNNEVVVHDLLNLIDQTIKNLTGFAYHEGGMPQFLTYDTTYGKPEVDSDSGDYTTMELLPDGLHVDTVATVATVGRRRQHLTTLLYLTDNPNGGATVFPLARTNFVNAELRRRRTTTTTREETTKNQAAAIEAAAERLLIVDPRAHTRAIFKYRPQRLEEAQLRQFPHDATTLEQVATRLVSSYHDQNQTRTGGGLLVQLEAGKLCVFCNIRSDGTPDPLAFHGASALWPHETNKKMLLSQFSTCIHRDDYFDDYDNYYEINQDIRKAREQLLHRYFR